jgi:allantoin racemase
MTIYVINPNASVSMTQQLEAENSGLNISSELIFLSCPQSPKSIEGYSDGANAAFYLLQLIEEIEYREDTNPEAYIIACFDDTGLDAARELTARPVLGIGQSSMQAATLLCYKFCIITAMNRSVPILERNVTTYGFGLQCAGVFAANMPVLTLKDDPDGYQKVLKVAAESLGSSKGEALVLGCAGLSHWTERLSKDLAMPVLDGVKLAIKFAQVLVDLKLTTSKINSYRFPEIK